MGSKFNTPIPRSGTPRFHESSHQRSLRDSEAVPRAWSKNQQTAAQVASLASDVANMNRQLQRVRRRNPGPEAVRRPFELFWIGKTETGGGKLAIQPSVISARGYQVSNSYLSGCYTADPLYQNFATVEPDTTVDIYMTWVDPDANASAFAQAQRPQFVAVTDEDYSAVELFFYQTDLGDPDPWDWTWFSKHLAQVYYVKIATVTLTSIVYENIDGAGDYYIDFPALTELVNLGDGRSFNTDAPTRFAGIWEATAGAAYSTGSLLVYTGDTDFDYLFQLDQARSETPGSGWPFEVYSLGKVGPMLGSAATPDVTKAIGTGYPWRKVAKMPKDAAVYGTGAYDPAKYYLKKAV